MGRYSQGMLIILAALLIGGCRQAWHLEVETRDSGLIFVLPEEAADQRVALQDFQVQKQGCTADCVFWSVDSRINASGELELWTVADRAIVFGQTVPELKTTVVAKELTSGNYSAGGSVSLYQDGEFTGSRIVAVEFELAVDSAGNPVIRR